MADMLADGTVLPSFLRAVRPNGTTGARVDNYTLRAGQVTKVIYPGAGGKFIRYRVAVSHYENGASVQADYICTPMSMFGTPGDRLRYTLRAPPSHTKQTNGYYKGAKVLVLCVDGQRANAIIIGCFRDENEDGDSAVSNESYYQWEYNGFQTVVDDAGQYTLTFNGATDFDGNLRQGVDSDASGSTFQFLKDGSIALTHDQQTIAIDVTNQQVNIKALKYLNLTAGTTVKVAAPGINLAGPDGEVFDAAMLGTIYRTNEQVLHGTLIDQLAGMAVGLNAAAAAAVADPATAALAPGLSAAGLAAAQMAQAIQLFEQQAKGYLSQVVKLA